LHETVPPGGRPALVGERTPPVSGPGVSERARHSTADMGSSRNDRDKKKAKKTGLKKMEETKGNIPKLQKRMNHTQDPVAKNRGPSGDCSGSLLV